MLTVVAYYFAFALTAMVLFAFTGALLFLPPFFAAYYYRRWRNPEAQTPATIGYTANSVEITFHKTGTIEQWWFNITGLVALLVGVVGAYQTLSSVGFNPPWFIPLSSEEYVRQAEKARIAYEKEREALDNQIADLRQQQGAEAERLTDEIELLKQKLDDLAVLKGSLERPRSSWLLAATWACIGFVGAVAYKLITDIVKGYLVHWYPVLQPQPKKDANPNPKPSDQGEQDNDRITVAKDGG